MADMLELAGHLPQAAFAAGETVLSEGSPSGELWVLVSGVLGVWRGDAVVGSVSQPGAIVGEASLLLGIDHTVTVRATEPSRLRYAADGHALLTGNPEVITLVAVNLAQRLASVTTYLADLEHQYGEAPGLSMVNDVIGTISMHHPPAIRTGSVRDPDPEY